MKKITLSISLLTLFFTSFVTTALYASPLISQGISPQKMNIDTLAKTNANPASHQLAPRLFHYKLKNGLTIFVKVDRRAPVVLSQVWYKVGGSYEKNGLTGISHVVEHMMFEGSKHYPDGIASKIVAANGGQENAGTGSDYTYYYQELAASKLPISFKLEADRMQNLNITEKAFAKEIKVVREERRMRTDNNPQALTYERFRAAAFIASPYHHPVVGWMSDLNHMTYLDVIGWYQSWYTPSNAILMVVGDVNPHNVYQLAKKYFGPIPDHQIPYIRPTAKINPLGERSLTVEAPAKLPWIIMGYNVPSLTTLNKKNQWKGYALEAAAAILDGGYSARLQQDIVRDSQIASSVDASYNPFARLSPLFTLSGSPTPTHTTAQLKKAFLAEIKKLQEKPVSNEELIRIRNQVTAQKIFSKDSLFNQAVVIAAPESVGLSWKVGEDFSEAFSKITPAQIMAVAREYLIPVRLTVATLKPIKK